MNQTAEALRKRYLDAYGIAHSTARFGSKIKKAARIVAIIAAAFYVMKIGADSFNYRFDVSDFYYQFYILVMGFGLAVFVYICGVIISAQGQIMLAMLDTAVNTSPHAEAADKAMLMAMR